MFDEPGQTVFFFLRIHRFGNAIGIKDQAGRIAQRDLRFGVVPAGQPQRQATLNVHKLVPSIVYEQWLQVPSIGEHNRSRDRIKDRINSAVKFREAS